MIITAMLSWFDEPPELLRQAVRGAAVIADRIVVADGAYELVEDKAAHSPTEQVLAIGATARECGLELTMLNGRIWAGQVEKRNAVMTEAVKGSDWVMVVDADWMISGDGLAIRHELQSYLEDGTEQVEMRFYEPLNPARSLDENAATQWHKDEAGQTRWLSLIYRVMDNLHYEGNHWTIKGNRPDGSEALLFSTMEATAATARLRTPHMVGHRCLFREPKHIARNRAFIRRRDEAIRREGVER